MGRVLARRMVRQAHHERGIRLAATPATLWMTAFAGDDGGAVVDTGRRIVRGGRPLLPVSTRTSFAGVVTVERGLGY